MIYFTLSLESSRQLSFLKRDLGRTARRAFASGSWSNLRTQIKAYVLFTTYFKLQFLPATLDIVCLYATFLSRSFRSPQSIRNYISGLKFLHILLGHEYRFTSDYVLSLVFRGIEKTLRHVPVRARPVTPAILHAMAAAVNFEDFEDVTCLCAAVFMFSLMARAGNVFVRADQGLHFGLKRKHVRCEGDVMLITFKSTKTIQCGKRVLHIPMVASPASTICPVALYNLMIQFTPDRPPSTPLFAVLDGDCCFPMSKAGFLSRFRVLLGKAGIPHPEAFSCPSFRRGGLLYS